MLQNLSCKCFQWKFNNRKKTHIYFMEYWMNLSFQPSEHQVILIQIFLNIKYLMQQWCWSWTQRETWHPKMVQTFFFVRHYKWEKCEIDVIWHNGVSNRSHTCRFQYNLSSEHIVHIPFNYEHNLLPLGALKYSWHRS